jgi:transmembrane sensor
MSAERFSYLIRNYAANSSTDEEVEELFEWLRQHHEDESIQAELEKMAATIAPDKNYDPAYWEPFINSMILKSDSRVRSAPFRRSWSRYAVAASVILLISISGYLWFNNSKPHPSPASHHLAQAGILPGRERATLTLANGATIALDTTTGNIVKQGAFTVINLNGKLDYEGKDDAVHYHTLSTPKGGQYRAQLPDGTEVWLNAASSITYPTAFTGADRRVTVSGEVYFEVAKDKTKPFKINVDSKSAVEVLGTHFNVNAYADDGIIKTTLLEGSVKVSQSISMSSEQQPGPDGTLDKKGSVVLCPGEQAMVVLSAAESGNPTGITIKSDANLDQVTAWKYGLFNFEQADLKTVMAQLSRWYDIDIKYEGAVPSRRFRGKMTRDLNLSQVIKILEDVDVKFRIEGRTLVVMR